MTDATFERDVLADAAFNYASTWLALRDYHLRTPHGLVTEDRQAELSENIERARKTLDAAAIAYADADAVRQAEEPEPSAVTAMRVTLYGVECYLPSSIAKQVQEACDHDGVDNFLNAI